MELTLAVLADYSNITREGKLNIMGIFDRLVMRQLPGPLPHMQLVIRLEAAPDDVDREHAIRVQLAGPDDDVLLDLNGGFTPRGGEPGQPVSVNHVLNFGNVPLQKPGPHLMRVWVDDRLKREIPLFVQRAPEPPHPSQGQGPGRPPGPDAPVH